jgi:hypothetical protein
MDSVQKYSIGQTQRFAVPIPAQALANQYNNQQQPQVQRKSTPIIQTQKRDIGGGEGDRKQREMWKSMSMALTITIAIIFSTLLIFITTNYVEANDVTFKGEAGLKLGTVVILAVMLTCVKVYVL